MEGKYGVKGWLLTRAIQAWINTDCKFAFVIVGCRKYPGACYQRRESAYGARLRPREKGHAKKPRGEKERKPTDPVFAIGFEPRERCRNVQAKERKSGTHCLSSRRIFRILFAILSRTDRGDTGAKGTKRSEKGARRTKRTPEAEKEA